MSLSAEIRQLGLVLQNAAGAMAPGDAAEAMMSAAAAWGGWRWTPPASRSGRSGASVPWCGSPSSSAPPDYEPAGRETTATSLLPVLATLSRTLKGAADRGEGIDAALCGGLALLVDQVRPKAVHAVSRMAEADVLEAIARATGAPLVPDDAAPPAEPPPRPMPSAAVREMLAAATNVVPMPIAPRPTARVIPIRTSDDGGAA